MQQRQKQQQQQQAAMGEEVEDGEEGHSWAAGDK